LEFLEIFHGLFAFGGLLWMILIFLGNLGRILKSFLAKIGLGEGILNGVS
jgi:hypothetical protein